MPDRPGGVCKYCGRTVRDVLPDISLESAFSALRERTGPIDPDDPNYWVYLMHDLEIIAEPIEPRAGAGLAFYGKRQKRKAS